MTKIQDNKVLPVNSARTMAFLIVLMSLGFVAVLFSFFLKDVFYGVLLFLMLAIMVFLAVLSSVLALKRLMLKILCSSRHQPFFCLTALFYSLGNRASCHKMFDGK